MDDSTRTGRVDFGPRENPDTDTMQEIWLFSSRQCVALETIALSLRGLLTMAETFALLMFLIYVGSLLGSVFARKILTEE